MDDAMVLDRRAAATYLGVTPSWLDRSRCTGEGPRFLKLGRRTVRYRREDLNEFLQSRLYRATSDVSGTDGADGHRWWDRH